MDSGSLTDMAKHALLCHAVATSIYAIMRVERGAIWYRRSACRINLFLVPVMCRWQQEEKLELALLVAVCVESCMFDGHIRSSARNQAIVTGTIVHGAISKAGEDVGKSSVVHDAYHSSRVLGDSV